MTYTLFLEKQSVKFLSKLDRKTNLRIFEKINLLKSDPFPSNSKKLINFEGVFRIRVGFYRILYRLEGEKLIIVFLIDKRSKIYRNK